MFVQAFRTSRFLLCLVPVVFLAACATEAFTGRRTLQLVPEAQLNQMGLQAYQQILSEAKVSSDTAKIAQLNRVGKRIAAVVDRRIAEEGKEPYEWEFTLIDDPNQVNAFALPGGKVAFYTGILPVCQSEAGIAVVMGHEIAHAYAGHGNNRASTQIVLKYGTAAVDAFLSGTAEPEIANLTMAALGVGGKLGTLAFSRADESAADTIGLMVMAEAGYDPREAVEFWKRMDQLSGGGEGSVEFLSTHPSHSTRIEDLNDSMPEALKLYEKSRQP